MQHIIFKLLKRYSNNLSFNNEENIKKFVGQLPMNEFSLNIFVGILHSN